MYMNALFFHLTLLVPICGAFVAVPIMGNPLCPSEYLEVTIALDSITCMNRMVTKTGSHGQLGRRHQSMQERFQ